MRLSSIALFVLVGCAADARDDARASAPAAFSAWGDATLPACALSHAREEVFRACLIGRVSQPDLDRAKAWARRGLLTWLRVGKSIDDRVTSRVELGCDDRHITFYLRNGRGTSFATPSSVTIYMSRPYGTWTHEIGHAFSGLLDTYQGAAGTCRPGQPHSLMCWGAYGPRSNPNVWSTLWSDDLEGLAANHRRLFGEALTPASWAGTVDLERPLDPDKPWPGAEPVGIEQPDATQVTVDADAPATKIEPPDDPGSVDL